MPPKRINGNRQQPTFTLSNGTVLALRPITQLIYYRWLNEFNRRYPEPKIPRITLENGDEDYDVENKGYLQMKAEYDLKANLAANDFILRVGVLTTPPPDWVSSFGFNNEPKLDWLMEQVSDTDELGELIEAISSIDIPTKAATEEAEKN